MRGETADYMEFSARLIRTLVILSIGILGIGILVATSVNAGVREGAEMKPGPKLVEVNQQKYVYIVQMEAPPALAMSREPEVRSAVLNGSQKKRRTTLRRFDRDSPRVQMRVRKIKAQQDALLETLQAKQDRIYDYQYTFNGMAVSLTPDQARKLRLRRDVRNVWKDQRRKVSTSSSPAFLGLFKATGGLRSDLGLHGEDIIIGVIDSGITANHPSMSDRDQRKIGPRFCRSEWGETSLLGKFLCARFKDRQGRVVFDEPPTDWNGICQAGENFPASACNNKLIGARFYREGFDLGGEADENEFDSPADADGHGTHIASIAAGNQIEAQIFGRDVGQISGMAPRARVAVYKACWLEPGAFRASCSVADLQKAIEDAVADGVDVINYSVGALRDSLTEPDDLALLAAAEAGVPSAVAAGNSGPSGNTIISPGTTPWVITVGATSRTGTKITEAIDVLEPASLADLYESKEASFTPSLASITPITTNLILVDDDSTGTPDGGIGTTIDACSNLQNTDALNGNIAFIQRGGCDFQDKIEHAEAAGAVGAVVFSNDSPLTVMAGLRDSVNIPAVMITQSAGQMIRDVLGNEENVVVTLDKNLRDTIVDIGNEVGAFSGRGPNLADPDFLKPDLVAPGVDILGGQSPNVANGFRGELFQYLSGTSQSAPHVAGIAALLREAHPDWNPSAIKSALMTSSRQNIVREDGTSQADPFDMGAGHIVPNSAVDPGLLYEIEPEEYDAYLCMTDQPRLAPDQCEEIKSNGLAIDAKDLNLPSIAITELVASDTVTRKVRNPGFDNQFQVEIDAPDGLEVIVKPEILNLSTDDTAEFTVQFTNTNEFDNEWLYGGITWVSDEHRVYSPFMVKPTLFSFTPEISIVNAPTTGSADFEISFGDLSSYMATKTGLFKACTLPDENENDDICPFTNAKKTVQMISGQGYEFVENPPASVQRFIFTNDETDNLFMRFRITDDLVVGDGDDDLDLYLFHCNKPVGDACSFSDYSPEPIGASFGPGSNHTIDIDASHNVMMAQPIGTFILDVHGFQTVESDGIPGAMFSVHAWSFGADDLDNFVLSGDPVSPTSGATETLTVEWEGLDAATYLGAVIHKQDADTTLGFTLLDIDTTLPVEAPR